MAVCPPDAVIYFEADITPGSSPGLAAFGGHVHFGPQANLEIEIAGPTKGSQYDAVDIAGDASLDGALTVRLIDGYLSLPGQSFQIMTYSSRSGQFGDIISDTGRPGLWFEADYQADSLTIRAAALGGDANLDGVVNIADLSILAANWQRGVGGGSAVTFEEAMGMFDVFGGVLIPEPAGLVALALGPLFLGRRRSSAA